MLRKSTIAFVTNLCLFSILANAKTHDEDFIGKILPEEEYESFKLNDKEKSIYLYKKETDIKKRTIYAVSHFVFLAKISFL